MQTGMSRGPLAEDEHSRKKEQWGAAGLRPAAPTHFLFCRGHPLPFPLHFCLHFIRRFMVNVDYFSNANASANANANAQVLLNLFLQQ